MDNKHQNTEDNNKVEGQKQDPQIQIKHTMEIGGPKGPEPTRYGDWEKKGRCIDF